MNNKFRREVLFEQNGLKINENKDMGGLELFFVDTLTKEQIQSIKDNGFRWSKKQQMWYAHKNEVTENFSKKLQKTYESRAERIHKEEIVIENGNKEKKDDYEKHYDLIQERNLKQKKIEVTMDELSLLIKQRQEIDRRIEELQTAQAVENTPETNDRKIKVEIDEAKKNEEFPENSVYGEKAEQELFNINHTFNEEASDSEYDTTLVISENNKIQPIELTPEDLKYAKKYLPKQQYATVLEYTQGEEGEHFKRIIKRISETAKANEGKRAGKNESGQTPLLFKYFLGNTRWYISEIGKDGTGFGYCVLNGDTQNSEWGYVNIKEISEIEIPTDIPGYKLSPEMSFYEREGETVERIAAEEFPELRAEMGLNEAEEKTVKLIPQGEKEEPVSIEENTSAGPAAGNTPHPTPITEENFESLNITPGTIVHSIGDDTYWRITDDNGFTANMKIVNPDGTTLDITGNTERSAIGHGLKQLLAGDVSQRYELPAREPRITYSIATTDEFNSEIIRKGIQTADAAVKNDNKSTEIHLTSQQNSGILEERGGKITPAQEAANEGTESNQGKIREGSDNGALYGRGNPADNAQGRDGGESEAGLDKNRNLGGGHTGAGLGDTLQRNDRDGEHADTVPPIHGSASDGRVPARPENGNGNADGKNRNENNKERRLADDIRISGSSAEQSGSGLSGVIFADQKDLTPAGARQLRAEIKEILENHTDEEISRNKEWLQKLVLYEGGGGLKEDNATAAETLNAFYTPRIIGNTVWQLADFYAPGAVTVLEPSSGTGRFAENRPDNKFTLRELDKTSARIAKLLHPDANVIQGAFQEQFFDKETKTVLNKNYKMPKYDLVIGNPPYGEYADYYKGLGEGTNHSRYETYFIEKGIDSLKNEDSVLAFVIPSGFLRNQSSKVKELIGDKATLVDAYRLPNKAFDTTEIGTDIIILKKNTKDYRKELNATMSDEADLKEAQEHYAIFNNDNWFKSHPEKVLGISATRSGRFGPEPCVNLPEGKTLEDVLRQIPLTLTKEILRKENPSLTEEEAQDCINGKLLAFGDINKVYKAEMTDIKESIKLHNKEQGISEEPENPEAETAEGVTTEEQNPKIEKAWKTLVEREAHPDMLKSEKFLSEKKIGEQIKTSELKSDIIESKRFWGNGNNHDSHAEAENLRCYIDLSPKTAMIALNTKEGWRKFASINEFGEVDDGGIYFPFAKKNDRTNKDGLSDSQIEHLKDLEARFGQKIKDFFNCYMGTDLRGNIYLRGDKGEISPNGDEFTKAEKGKGYWKTANKWFILNSENGDFGRVNPPKIYSAVTGVYDHEFELTDKDSRLEPIFVKKEMLFPENGKYDLLGMKEYSDSVTEKHEDLKAEMENEKRRREAEDRSYSRETYEFIEACSQTLAEEQGYKDSYKQYEDGTGQYCDKKKSMLLWDDCRKLADDRLTEKIAGHEKLVDEENRHYLDDLFTKAILSKDLESLKDFKEHKIEFSYTERKKKDGTIEKVPASFLAQVADDPTNPDNTLIYLDGNRILGLNKKNLHVTAYNGYDISPTALSSICKSWGKKASEITVSGERYDETAHSIKEELEKQIPTPKQAALAKNVSEALLEAIRENDGEEMLSSYTGFSVSNRGTRTFVFTGNTNNPAIEYDKKHDTLTFYQDAYDNAIISLVEKKVQPELEKTAPLSIYKKLEINGGYYVDLNGHTTKTAYIPQKYIPKKEELLSSDEFSKLYNKKCTKDEKAIWTATSWDGHINIAKLNDEQKEILRSNENYVEETTGHYIHREFFASGNIYSKLEALEKELKDNNITKEIYEKNKKILEEAKPKLIPVETLNILPYEHFGKTYELNGKTLQKGFIEWATNCSAEETENAPRRISNFAETPISRNDIPENITWGDIYDFANEGTILDKVKKNRKQSDEDVDLINNEKENSARKACSILFNRYIKEGLTEEERAKTTADYNRIYNANRSPDYENLPLFVEDANAWHNGKKWIYKEQQIKGASFLAYKRNGLLGYDVGVGKTATDILTVAAQIQNGTSKRPLVVVPKSVYSKWVNDFQELFPNIPVNKLYNGGEKYTGQYSNGKHGLNIPAGSVSVVTKEFLKNVSFKKQTITDELLEPAVEYIGAQKSYRGDNKRDRADAEMKAITLLGTMNRVEDSKFFYWENTGFDNINLDEAHFYKNAYADRSVKIFGISAYTQLHNDGCGMTLLTATPFPKATPQEVYSMLSYFCKNKLKELHIEDFTEFENTFVNYENELAVDTKGNISVKKVMKSYNKLNILQNIFNEYIDYKTADEARVIRPEREDIPVYLDPTPEQKEWFALAKEIMIKAPAYDESRGKDNPKPTARTLVGLNLMKQACLSPATIKLPKILDIWARQDPDGFAQLHIPQIPLKRRVVEDSPKLKYICDNIVKVWKQDHTLGQIVYMPNGTECYPDVINYMVNQGIPRSVFGTIDGQEDTIGGKKVTLSKDDEEEFTREKVCKAFNDVNNPCKIIIGSAAIREGVDLNGNTIATYNTSIDWNPGDQKQLTGRAQRQGNALYSTFYVVPLMNDSSDPIVQQLLDEKGERANDLFRDPNFENQEIKPEEVKFRLITDPEQVAQMEIDRRVKEKESKAIITKNTIEEIKELSENLKGAQEKVQNIKEEKAEYHYNWASGKSERTEEAQKEGEARYDTRIEKAQWSVDHYKKNLKLRGIENEKDIEDFEDKQNSVLKDLLDEATKIKTDTVLHRQLVKEAEERKEAERIKRLEKSLTRPLAEYMLSKKQPFYLLEFKKMNEYYESDKQKYRDDPERLEKIDREYKFWRDGWEEKYGEKKQQIETPVQKEPVQKEPEKPVANPTVKAAGKFTVIAEGPDAVKEFKPVIHEEKTPTQSAELPKMNRAAKNNETEQGSLFDDDLFKGDYYGNEIKQEGNEKQENVFEKSNAMKREAGDRETEAKKLNPVEEKIKQNIAESETSRIDINEKARKVHGNLGMDIF